MWPRPVASYKSMRTLTFFLALMCLVPSFRVGAWQAPERCATLTQEDVVKTLCANLDPDAKIAEFKARGLAFPVDVAFVRGATARCGVQPEKVVSALFDYVRPACPPELPVIELFEAMPSRIVQGTTSRLRWRTRNASRTELEGHEVPAEGTQETPILKQRTGFILRVFAAGVAPVERTIYVDVDSAPIEVLPDGPPVTRRQAILLLDAARLAGAEWDRRILDRLIEHRLVSFLLTDEARTQLERRGASRTFVAAVFASPTVEARDESSAVAGPIDRVEMELLVRLKMPEKAIADLCRSWGIGYVIEPADARLFRSAGIGDLIIPTLTNLVNAAPTPYVRLEADPIRVTPGQRSTIFWTIRNTQFAHLNILGTEELPAEGSRTFTIDRDTEFVMTASNLGKVFEARVWVRVVHLPALSGVLIWRGNATENSEWAVPGLPGVPVTVEFDKTRWALAVAPSKANDYRVLYLRSIKPGIQHSAEVTWRVAQ